MSPTDAKIGLLLVGHGTRSSQGRDEFLALARLAAGQLEKAGTAVEPAFLELTDPSIRQGLARLVEHGVQNVVVQPLMLFAAGHVRRDIPRAVKAAAGELGAQDVPCQFADHLGCDPLIVQLSGQRFTESLHGQPPVPPEQTCLLLVGRGSRDDDATAQMHHFARLRSEKSSLGSVRVAFLAMASPAVQDVLPQLAAENWQRVVVQPHLLFHGELLDRLQSQVMPFAARNSQQQWALAPHLGLGLNADEPAAEPLVAAILQRFQVAAIRVVAPAGDG